MYDVRDFHRHLEESHWRPGRNPADLAWEQHNAEAENAAESGYDVVFVVIAYVGYQYDGSGYKHTEQSNPCF